MVIVEINMSVLITFLVSAGVDFNTLDRTNESEHQYYNTDKVPKTVHSKKGSNRTTPFKERKESQQYDIPASIAIAKANGTVDSTTASLSSSMSLGEMNISVTNESDVDGKSEATWMEMTPTYARVDITAKSPMTAQYATVRLAHSNKDGNSNSTA